MDDMRKVILAATLWLCAFAAMAEPIRIAALGDSLTQGYGLAPQDGFVPQMSQWLDDHGADVVLINAGVSGDTTAGGARRVAWTLGEDIDGMIVALGGNDLLRGIDPAISRANLRAILDAADEAEVEVLLIGLSAPGNYGPDYKAAFDRIYPDLAERYGVLYAPDFLAGLGEAAKAGQAADLIQEDGIHPNAKGVALIVAALGPSVLDLVARIADGND